MATTFSRRLLQYRWLNLINQLLGLIFLSEWFVLFNTGFFNPAGFAQRITEITTKSHYNIFNQLFFWVANHAAFVCYAVSAVLLINSALMVLRLCRWVVNWIGVGIAFIYVVAHLTYPGTWLFEFAAPFLFLTIIALSTHFDRHLDSKKAIVLGFNVVDLVPSGVGIVAGLLCSLAVFYFLIVSNAGGAMTQRVGFETSIVFFVLFIISEMINRYRVMHDSMSAQNENYLIWMNYYWFDYLLMTIGIILICQVIMDQQLSWFSVQGYQNLVNVYATSSHAPLFIRHFLEWSSHQGAWMAPTQHAIESFLAIGAVLLIYRFPVSLGIFALCGLLTFSEFGVPATWPPTPHAEVTWTWELLSITLVAGAIALYHMAVWMQKISIRSKVLGEGVFSNLSFAKGLAIVVLISIGIGIYIILTHSLKTLNHAFALESAVSSFLYLSLTLAIDQLRVKSEKTLKSE